MQTESKEEYSKQKSLIKVVEASLNISTILIYRKGLHLHIKRQRLSDWIQKSIYMLLIRYT